MSAPSFLKSLPISSYPRFKCPLSEITLSPSAARAATRSAAPPRRSGVSAIPGNKRISSSYYGCIFMKRYVGPKGCKPHRRLKPCLIHGLFKPALPASRCLHGEKDRLKIRRKSRVWPGVDLDPGRTPFHHHTDPGFRSGRPGYPDPGSHFSECL